MTRLTIRREQRQAQYFTEDLENGIGLDMVLIPSGSFWMGTQDEEIEKLVKEDGRYRFETERPQGRPQRRDRFETERPQHRVNIARFFLGRYPITQAQWRVVADEKTSLKPDPSDFKDDYQGINRWTRPVEQVSLEEVQAFCYALSKKTGREYRLPTEAEWEYACRAGTTTPFHFGETISTDLANYRGTDWYAGDNVVSGNYGRGSKGKYREQTTPVGYFKVASNNFGLCDMHGNVWEWCRDDWHDNYEDAPTDGSAWHYALRQTTVIRGGSWDDSPASCRSASRNFGYSRIHHDNKIGFRVVCVAL